MRIIIFSLSCFSLSGCPVARAHDTLELSRCVIDVCEEELCTVETPEGIVYIEKESHYKEGMSIDCPMLPGETV